MKKFFKYLPITLFICIVFLSIGFASFSNNLSINDISASVRNVKDIRVTNFYAVSAENNAESIWEEYSSEVVASNVIMPDIDSTISYKMEVTNLGDVIMMIDDITGLPDNMTYIIEDFDLKHKICDLNRLTDPCKSGIQKEITIKIMYKENAEVVETAQLIQLNINFEEYSYQVAFDANGGLGNMDPISLTYDEMATLPANTFTNSGYIFNGWNTAADGSGDSYDNEAVIQNINTNEELEVTLYAQWTGLTDGFYYPGYCIFNGQGQAVEGECADGVHLDYVDTGVQLFSEANYQRNFILSFTIKEISDAAFTSNNRDTIFNSLLEEEEGEYGTFPGLVLRVEGTKWLLQASKGQDPNRSAKVLLDKEDLLNKELKIIRFNDGETIKIYYMIDGHGPYLLKDMTDLYSPFDTTLMFGASTEAGEIYRHSVATLKDISFEFLPDGITLDDIAGGSAIEPGEMTTVFSQEGSCIFNGEGQNITGDDCGLYEDTDLIDTEINLFGIGHLSDDFEIYFEIEEFVPGIQNEAQVTILGLFRERNNALGYGLLIRRNSSNLQLILRDGNGKEKKLTINPTTTQSIKIIKKGNNLCYSANGGNFTFLLNISNFLEPFEVPLTFGGGIDKNDEPFRQIIGELSNMYVKTGRFDDSVVCYQGM